MNFGEDVFDSSVERAETSCNPLRGRFDPELRFVFNELFQPDVTVRLLQSVSEGDWRRMMGSRTASSSVPIVYLYEEVLFVW